MTAAPSRRSRALALAALVLAAVAPVRADDQVAFKLEMPPETRRDWVRCLESYEEGFVRLNPGTGAACAESAMRLTQQAIRQSDVGPGILDSIAVIAELDREALSALGFGEPADATGLAIAYLTAANPDEYVANIEQWAARRAAAGAARPLPAGFGPDGLLSEAAVETARALYFDLVRKFSAAELSRGFRHPACGDIELRFKLIAGRQLGSRAQPFLRFASRGVCTDGEAGPGLARAHAFGVVADFPVVIDAGAESSREVTLHLAPPGHSMVTAACEP